MGHDWNIGGILVDILEVTVSSASSMVVSFECKGSLTIVTPCLVADEG